MFSAPGDIIGNFTTFEVAVAIKFPVIYNVLITIIIHYSRLFHNQMIFFISDAQTGQCVDRYIVTALATVTLITLFISWIMCGHIYCKLKKLGKVKLLMRVITWHKKNHYVNMGRQYIEKVAVV